MASRASRLPSNVLGRLVLREWMPRVLSKRVGNCISPRRGMGAAARVATRLGVRARLPADGLPAAFLDDGGFIAADWLARWAWHPYDTLARLIALLVQPGDVAADVGAFTGWYAYVMAVRAGPSGAVHLFEPQPGLSPLLCETFAWLPNVVCHFAAVGAANGVLPFHCNASPSMSSLVWAQPGHQTVDVPVERLDVALADAARLGRLSFVKIDVEGYEAAALDGAAGLFEGVSRRPYLYLEMTEPTRAAAAGAPSTVFQRLRELHYDLYMAPQLTWRRDIPLKPLRDRPDPETAGWVDGLAVPQERGSDFDRLVSQRLVAPVSTY